MTSLINDLEAIEQAPQGNARLAMLKKHHTLELRNYLIAALDPMITYGVKKLPTVDIWATRMGFDWWTSLYGLSRKLALRMLTGHDAQQAIFDHLTYCDQLERKWSERLLKKDLRINIGAKDVNNALNEELIWLFKVPLATELEKIKKIEGRWAIQPKYDGARCVAVLPGYGEKVELFSRSGKIWKNFESIRKSLQEYNDIRVEKTITIYMDGEVICEKNDKPNFKQIQQTMMRKDGQEMGLLKYVVFDACEEGDWKNPTGTYEQRYHQMVELVKQIKKPNVDYINTLWTSSNVKTLFLDMCDRWTANGYEGAMGRRADLPVENKRSKRLIKIKTFKDDEAEIIGATEGTGKNAGMLGAILCKHKNGKTFEVGSGFDDEERMDIWHEHQTSTSWNYGKVISYKYQELSEDGVPRFPIFKGFRSTDDIS